MSTTTADIFDIVSDLVTERDNDPHCNGSGIRNSVRYLISESRGEYPSEVEVDACLEELRRKEYDGSYYQLCTVEGVPFEDAPEVFMEDRAADAANKSMKVAIWRLTSVLAEEQVERDAAEAVKRAAENEKRRHTLKPEERGALNAYARTHGRTWKSKLRAEWMNASAEQILHNLRNHSCFGPAGLEKYKAV